MILAGAGEHVGPGVVFALDEYSGWAVVSPSALNWWRSGCRRFLLLWFRIVDVLWLWVMVNSMYPTRLL